MGRSAPRFPDLGDYPALRRIEQQGARAERLTPVFPANTFPGHVSLATGTYPDRHGIVDNDFLDRDAGAYHMSGDANWLQAEPLWIAAERQGVKTATYFWVGSENDWRGQGTSYRIAPFDGSRPEAEKVDQILAWLALPQAQRPRLIMSYWAGADNPGHRYGPDSDEVKQRIGQQDAQLGRLLDGLDRLAAWPYTTLLLVSDHGMAPAGRYLDLSGALEDAGIRATVMGGGVANVYLEDPAQLPEALTVARSVVAGLEDARVYARGAIPAELRVAHPTRIGDLVVLAQSPYAFSRPGGWRGPLMNLMAWLGFGFGGHGYDPASPDMGATFMAMGRGVPAGLHLPALHQIDVAPTAARLLGIQAPRDSEGRPIAGIDAAALSEQRP